MDIRQFRAELAEALLAKGFDQTKRKSAKAWVLPGREVERGFSEDAIRRPWGFLLSGVLTVDVPAFRSWLVQRFPEDQHGLLRGALLCRHIANEPGMYFGAEGEPPYGEWAELIRAHLSSLPDTVEGLLAAARQPDRLRVVWDKWAAPKAFRYFRAWAAGDEPNSPPPRRLPDGQIVDAAVNDPA